MAILDIYADSKNVSRCRSCTALITWVELTNGSKMPLEGTELAVLRTQGGLLEGRVIETIDTTISPTHWERCPDDKQWRRPR